MNKKKMYIKCIIKNATFSGEKFVTFNLGYKKYTYIIPNSYLYDHNLTSINEYVINKLDGYLCSYVLKKNSSYLFDIIDIDGHNFVEVHKDRYTTIKKCGLIIEK